MQSSAEARAWITRAVAGVTERPFQLGDHITEFMRSPSGPQEVLWHVTEHDRPRHAKLQAEDGTTVTYIFTGQGDDTSFRRVIELGSVLGAQQITSDTAKCPFTGWRLSGRERDGGQRGRWPGDSRPRAQLRLRRGRGDVLWGR
jgi:hypothetical protein